MWDVDWVFDLCYELISRADHLDKMQKRSRTGIAVMSQTFPRDKKSRLLLTACSEGMV